ncbi:exopolysaccharide biosynthesis polyprenyl glycosylphosphotransferase [Ponticaulis sp.]|uniref:exopolysaccharide biosynthesis polyprenyl glycosylphosphotransferase n=1 Tax=Ponticaulis sp. TaxID=2020902 RepID=UPI000B721264|nr:exopolysaccharide biosynthesis polyprenyl glycosylphosphotransferase [Ponticaulis sp.]MAI89702.1 exopolysaccharide biosynthesis polyprenyl glycosylphosphotransferase [Ponticaulis sp.]OUY00719.1 MAG: exopolysaccharide biosynthesis polyprenyl glycosylphosphotransferase [Hyphomonadaceae bacterium TMED5]|tara:strand:- start:83490 stop:85010 length:1521 start_codon:yes stop_codon:yes gene_type:complete
MSNTAEQLELDAPEARASAPAHLYPHEDGRPSLDDIRPLQNQFVIDRKTIRVLARAIDIAGLSLLALFSVSGLGIPVADLPLGVALPYMALPVLTVWALKSAGAYRFPFTEKILDHMAKVGLGSSFALAGLLSFSWLTGLGGSFLYLSGTAMIGGIFLMSAHAHHVSWTKHLIRKGRLSENVVIVGATDTASQLIERNSKDRELNIVAIFDDRLGRAPMDINGIPVVGTLDDLLAWEDLPNVDRIIVTVTTKAQNRVRLLVERLRYLPNRVVLLLDLDDYNPEGASLAQVAESPAAYVSGAPEDARRAFIKRISDVVIGGMMLIAFAPVMGIIALLIRMDSPGPVFFKQKRHGFNNKVIRVWKFRTMRPDSLAEEGIIRQVTSEDDRVTKIGKFLRRTSLDELPQLINILKGEMSLVGPRPHAVGMTTEETEVHHLVGDYAHRHRVKPGLTGWAQINGSRGPVHTAELVRERVRLDMEYVNRSSFWFDLYVMLMTAPCLLGDGNDR